MKTLIICTAIPACGKSSWAKRYKNSHPNTYIVSSDEIRLELTGGNYHDRSKQAEVWKVFSERIHEYGANEDATVILDALNDTNELRRKYVVENPEFDKYILAVFSFNPERSKLVNGERPKTAFVPDEVMDILINKFEQPTEEIKSLFDEIWNIEWSEKKPE